MKILNIKKNFLALGFCFIGITNISAQEYTNSHNQSVFTTIKIASVAEPFVTINQDPRIKQLLEIKTKMDKDGVLGDNYRIQLYTGNLNGANTLRNNAKKAFPQWRADIVYETPNHKVWIGNYRSKLETDRALKEIRKEFPNAFLFKPEKK